MECAVKTTHTQQHQLWFPMYVSVASVFVYAHLKLENNFAHFIEKSRKINMPKNLLFLLVFLLVGSWF